MEHVVFYLPNRGTTDAIQQSVVRRLLEAGILRRISADELTANRRIIVERAERLGSIVCAPAEGFDTDAVREAERRLWEHDAAAMERRLDAALAPFLKDEA